MCAKFHAFIVKGTIPSGSDLLMKFPRVCTVFKMHGSDLLMKFPRVCTVFKMHGSDLLMKFPRVCTLVPFIVGFAFLGTKS